MSWIFTQNPLPSNFKGFLIFNKKDRLTAEQIAALKIEYPDAIFLSTRDPEDLNDLRLRLIANFESDMQDEDVYIPYTNKGAIGEIRSKMRVLSESYNEKGTTLKVRASNEALMRLRKKFSI